MNIESVKNALKKYGNKRAVLVELGYHRNNSSALKKLSKIIKENSLECYLLHLQNRRKNTDWSEQNLLKVVLNSKTYTDVLILLGVVARGRNITILKEKIKKYNIDISHFNRYHNHIKKHEDVFVISKEIHTSTVKKKFLKLVPYKCNKCGISEWLGSFICLEMDHINGICFDHRVENLRLLCPNCHSQTSTHNKGCKMPDYPSGQRELPCKQSE